MVLEQTFADALDPHHQLPDAPPPPKSPPPPEKLPLSLELELEPVVVRGRHAALDHGPPLEHLHADVALMLDGFGNELVVKEVEHLALARGGDVHLHVAADVGQAEAGGGVGIVLRPHASTELLPRGCR